MEISGTALVGFVGVVIAPEDMIVLNWTCELIIMKPLRCIAQKRRFGMETCIADAEHLDDRLQGLPVFHSDTKSGRKQRSL